MSDREKLNLPLIDKALAASEAAYKPAWDAVTFEDDCGAFARVAETDDRLVLAFRGTDEAEDWLTNLRAIPWRYGGAWVHRGFMVAHQTLWDRVRGEIQRRGAKPLLVTGHSLGGALAELSCLFLRDYPAPVALTTFGKPNVFLKPRSARLGYLAYQTSVVSGSDGVARVPRMAYGPDLGQAMLYLATSNLQQDYWIPEMTDAHHRLIVADFDAIATVAHHNIVEYRRRLNKLINKPT